jgi:UDP-N-acetylmuramoylalanine--D-glutamate ligase
MIASILKAAGRRTFLGGNIGGSLLEQLPQIRPEDGVVLEISSFQLWHATPAAKMPQVAVVTGCSPNHLDWHESCADYVAAKQRILTGQASEDFAVLNTFDVEAASWLHLVRGRQVLIDVESRRHTPCTGPAHGVCGLRLDELPSLPVPGRHNRINAVCAAAAAVAAGCTREDIRRGLQEFRALPQRLEWFAVIEGRRFYNDSAATTPESTIAALRSLDVPIWLLAGGKSKGADFEPLATEIVRLARGGAFFGAAREELRARVAEREPRFHCTAVETMEQALQWCWPHCRPGEAILLSPACASTDQFRSFRQRGERFVELIHQWSNPLNLLTGNGTVV